MKNVRSSQPSISMNFCIESNCSMWVSLRELIMDGEEIMKTLEIVGFRGVPTSVTLETRMNIIKYGSCCSENLSKSLKGEFICILKNCIHTF